MSGFGIYHFPPLSFEEGDPIHISEIIQEAQNLSKDLRE